MARTENPIRPKGGPGRVLESVEPDGPATPWLLCERGASFLDQMSATALSADTTVAATPKASHPNGNRRIGIGCAPRDQRGLQPMSCFFSNALVCEDAEMASALNPQEETGASYSDIAV